MLPLADTAKQTNPAVINWLLIAANGAVFVWQMLTLLGGGEGALAGFIMDHALVPRRIVQHPIESATWLTVLTHMFMHGGIAHLLGNMWFLWLFGGNVECKLGHFRYLLLYVLSGVAAAAVQFATGPLTPVPMVGASGAISGVLGAYLLLFPTAWIWTLVPWVVPIVPVPAAVFLVLWFVLQTLSGLSELFSGLDGGIAWWAHAGGFAAGMMLVRKLRTKGR